MKLKSILEYFFCFSILLFALPGNFLFFIPVKIVTFIIILCIAFVYFIRNGIKVDKYFFTLISIIFLVFMWFLIGVNNGYLKSSLSNLQNYLSLFAIILLAYVFVINNVIGFRNVKNAFYLTMLFKVIWKIIIEIFAFTNLASQEVLNKLYILVFHTSPVFMRLEYGNLLRIQTPSDVLPIIIFGFYLLQKDRLYKKIIVTALMTIFVIIVYSRLFFIQYAALVGLVGVLYILEKYGIKKVVIALSVLIALVTSAVFLSHGASKFEKIITARFVSADTVKSDAVRGDQTQALVNVFLKSPVIGKGVGAYSEELIRNVDNKFSYEEEYLSFLMQLGIIGFTLIIIGSIVLFFRILNVSKVKDKKVKILIIFNFIFWAIRPLFNPGFLSSNSGIIIVILMFYSYYYVDIKVDEGYEVNTSTILLK